jgi:hypothetical protein
MPGKKFPKRFNKPTDPAECYMQCIDRYLTLMIKLNHRFKTDIANWPHQWGTRRQKVIDRLKELKAAAGVSDEEHTTLLSKRQSWINVVVEDRWRGLYRNRRKGV